MLDVPSAMVARLAARVTDADLLAEVQALAQTIAAVRAELQQLDTGPFIAGHVPAATDELDAVVAHTASATDSILEACEELERAGPGLDAALLQRATTRIYEACSFQDITGQRIGKVVGTLKAIETKVGRMLDVFGEAPQPPQPHAATSLTSGPQLPGAAMAQDDIDKLLADF